MTAPNALDHVRPVFRRILLWAALLAVGLAVVGGVVGLVVAGTPGLAGGLLGAVLSVVFSGSPRSRCSSPSGCRRGR